jgi:hypothetical protein
MEAGYISALAGLAGAVIGGLASFATSWLTQHAQLREKSRERQMDRREMLFTAIIDEASRLYGDALTHQKDDVAALVKLYALIGQIRLISSAAVLTVAEHMIDAIVEAYLAPNRTLLEIRVLAKNGKIDMLRAFAEACREELAILK